MNLTTKGKYAVTAALDLAINEKQTAFLKIADVAERQTIPPSYLDHNFNNLNYQEVSTELNFGKVKFNLDYLEENNHSGSEHYASPGISIDFNEQNNLSFSTKKNFKTDSTELYDLTYQYQIDCLTAGLVYRRKFYEDSDLQPNDTLMFAITFVPFGTVNTPTKN